MWTIKFKQDTDKKGVGTVTAVNGSFIYDDQLNTNNPDKVDAFVLAAKTKFANFETKEAELTTIEDLLLTKFNS